MELMTLDETRSLLTRAASLRGQGRQREAIDLIERNLPQLNDDLRLNALLEVVYAALEFGDRAKAVSAARLLAEIDPDIPTVRKLLSGTGHSAT